MFSKKEKKSDFTSTDRLSRYYEKFLDRNVGNLTISVAPVRDDIPNIKFMGFDELSKCYIIEYDLKAEAIEKKFKTDNVLFYQGSKTDKIGRIVIKVQNMNKIESESMKYFAIAKDQLRSYYHKTTEQTPNLEKKLKWTGRFDIIDRQLSESSELIDQLNK